MLQNQRCGCFEREKLTRVEARRNQDSWRTRHGSGVSSVDPERWSWGTNWKWCWCRCKIKHDKFMSSRRSFDEGGIWWFLFWCTNKKNQWNETRTLMVKAYVHYSGQGKIGLIFTLPIFDIINNVLIF